MIAAGGDRVRNAFTALESSDQSLIGDLHASLIMFKMIAEDLERDNNSEGVKKLDSATLEILRLSDEVAHHSTALQSLGEAYTAGNELTDFQKHIEDTTRQLMAESPSEPENHLYYKQFKEAVWKVHHSGEPMPGEENEEIVVTCSQYNVVNVRCPLTGKQIIDLEDPVRSLDCKHIYDRAAVMSYIKRHGTRRPCQCPAAGCPNRLKPECLICDAMLKIEIRELRMRGSVATQAHEVTDYTELDE